MLGILCGLSSEAKIASKIKGANIVCAAAVPQKARALAEKLVDDGATGLMSFGLAGGLDPTYPIGRVVIGRNVLSANGAWSCDEAWGSRLLAEIPNATRADIWGSETLVPTAAEKIGLYQKTGCSAVDMESQCAAEVAAAAKLPLAIVRVVCDKADHNLPDLVMAAINPDGSTNVKEVIKGLFRKPMQTLDLINVGRSMAKALKALEQAAPHIAL